MFTVDLCRVNMNGEFEKSKVRNVVPMTIFIFGCTVTEFCTTVKLEI